MLRWAVVSVVAVFLAGPAGALEFFFNGYGGFTNPGQGLVPSSPSPGFGPNFNYAFTNGFDDDVTTSHLFSWGQPVSGVTPSFITINDPPNQPLGSFQDRVTGGVTVDDPVGTLGMWIQHHNVPVFLTMNDGHSVAIHYHIDIYETFEDAQNLVNPLFESGPLDIRLDVWETSNSGACPNPDDESECDDRFQYGFGWLSDSVGEGVDELLGSFEFAGTTYDILFTGLFDASDDSLSPTFWSPEGGVSTMYATVRIVPEPATGGLLALGLLGLAASRQRSRARSAA